MDIKIPLDEQGQKNLLRALFNLRMPKNAGQEFLDVQDAYLQEEIRRRGITDLADLNPVQEGIYLWQGDITTLRCDAIVNAANSQMLGCFVPCHGCIDNAIHTFAGVQLRLACSQIMAQQGCAEETGSAKITPAFNLPCRYVLHTVGPIVHGRLRKEINSCWLRAIGPVWRWPTKMVFKALRFAASQQENSIFPMRGQLRLRLKQ